MKVVLVPDYRVSPAEKIIPSADLSEQISAAGKEASGTGNMKMALNGAVMIGTHDGTNLDICRDVGEENAYLFGLRSDEVQKIRMGRSYRPQECYERDLRVKRTVDVFRSRLFCRHALDFFAWAVRTLLDEQDEYLHLADFPAYLDAQDAAETAFADRQRWIRMSIRNVARVGMFSSDRTVKEYAKDIWEIDVQ